MHSSDVKSTFRQKLDDLSAAGDAIRRELKPLLDRLLPEGYGARSCGRSLGMGRGNGWRCWSVAHAPDGITAMRSMPGPRGWTQILDALVQRGATEDEISRLRAAIAELADVLVRHNIDRSTLRAMGAREATGTRERTLIRSDRRAAFKASSRMYGLHAKLAVSAFAIAPTRDGQSISVGCVLLTDGIARDRPGPWWPIGLRSVTIQEDTRVAKPYGTFGGHAVAPSVVRELSTPGIVGSAIVSGHRADRETIELADVPPEHNGSLRMVCAENLPVACMMKAGERLPCEFQQAALLPTEQMMLEVLVHRALRFTAFPAATLCGTPIFTAAQVADWKDAVRLPLECQPEQAESLAIAGHAASLNECHRAALAMVVAAQGSDIGDYVIYRLTLSHPPIYSSAVMSFEFTMPGARG